MNGTADKVQVCHHDKVCMCLACAEDPTLLETEEINILDEPLLMERFKHIGQDLNKDLNPSPSLTFFSKSCKIYELPPCQKIKYQSLQTVKEGLQKTIMRSGYCPNCQAI
jgi:hypothetical protein